MQQNLAILFNNTVGLKYVAIVIVYLDEKFLEPIYILHTEIRELASYHIILHIIARLVPIMVLKIAYYALEQCSRILPIMLKLCSICKPVCSTN